jgi:hypothetical protein
MPVEESLQPVEEMELGVTAEEPMTFVRVGEVFVGRPDPVQCLDQLFGLFGVDSDVLLAMGQEQRAVDPLDAMDR